MRARFHVTAALIVAALLPMLSAAATGGQLTGVPYNYDFSQPDPATGIFTDFHSAPEAQDPDNVKLSDGELGSEELVGDPGAQAVFTNGTWVGFVNDGYGAAPQPKVVFDFGDVMTVRTVEVTYLVEAPSWIFAPQPVPGTEFHGLSVATSTDGTSFTEAGFTDDFKPVYGENGDMGTDVRERRNAVLDLNGTQAAYLSVEVHTPYSYIFLGEVVIDVDEVSYPLGDVNLDGEVNGLDVAPFVDHVTGGTYQTEADMNQDGQVNGLDVASFVDAVVGAGAMASVPEPSTLVLVGTCLACLLGFCRLGYCQQR